MARFDASNRQRCKIFGGHVRLAHPKGPEYIDDEQEKKQLCPHSRHRIEPQDLESVRITSRLSAGQRIQRLLDGRELAVGLMRGRLRRLHPDLDAKSINLKVLEALERD